MPSLQPPEVLALQRSIGNRAVSRMLRDDLELQLPVPPGALPALPAEAQGAYRGSEQVVMQNPQAALSDAAEEIGLAVSETERLRRRR
jgi:hypothetical protein